VSAADPGTLARIEAGSEAVKEWVGYFRERFGAVESEWKEDASRVTEADRAISEGILRRLSAKFPSDDLCCEETAGKEEVRLSGRFGWLLDPIDGTNNYALGIPHCAISLALLEEGVPVYGWVYDFAGNRLVQGGAGLGMRTDDRPVERVAPVSGDPNVPVGLQFPVGAGALDRFRFLLRSRRVRSLGSSTMEGLYVALGQFEGAVDFRVRAWDIGAFVAFFRETGTPHRFLREAPFPLRTFSAHIPPCPYLAGTPEFCRTVEEAVQGLV
jgi:myo-inositol-1(or 4)-monophosphatase